MAGKFTSLHKTLSTPDNLFEVFNLEMYKMIVKISRKTMSLYIYVYLIILNIEQKYKYNMWPTIYIYKNGSAI